MLEHGKVEINEDIIHIVNWEKYQGEYERLRKWREEEKTRNETANETRNETKKQMFQLKQEMKRDIRGRGEGRGGGPEDHYAFTNVKAFPELKNKVNNINDKRAKTAFIIDAFKTYHTHAPPGDFENLGGRIAGILKSISFDYGYLLKLIWDTSSADIAGSHLSYIQGKIKGVKSRGRLLPTDEERERSLK